MAQWTKVERGRGCIRAGAPFAPVAASSSWACCGPLPVRVPNPGSGRGRCVSVFSSDRIAIALLGPGLYTYTGYND